MKQYKTLDRILAFDQEEKDENFQLLEIADDAEFGVKYAEQISGWVESEELGDYVGYSFRSRKIEIIGTAAVLTIDYDLEVTGKRPILK